MYIVLPRLFALLILGCTVSAAAAQPLPETLRAPLLAAAVPDDAVAIWVQTVDAPEPSLAVNANQAMNPASVMKLVTAYAALRRFGPAHTWTTRVAADGTMQGTTLEGNLYLVGGADPLLSYERLWKILRQLRALGIERVAGDIVLDGSALRLPPHDPAAFDGRPLRPYNSGASGLLLHFNTLQLRLIPAAESGRLVELAALPGLRGLHIDNRITTTNGSCGLWYGNLDANLEAGPDGPRLVLQGSLPASCGQRDWATAPLSPEQFGQALVAGLWTEIGGRVDGTVRSGNTSPAARTLMTETSPPLADAVREMNKWSSNVIARQLLASLGAESPAAIDMVTAGAHLAQAELAADGIDTRALVIENGSGLSRDERVSARLLGELLLAAWRSPFMPEFIAALPVAGVDGTARRRLGDSPARGHAHIKTGSINQVRAFAGYVLDRNGRRHVVAMLVNHPNAGATYPAQDALVEWVWQGGTDAP